MFEYNIANADERLLFKTMYLEYMNELGLYSERIRKNPVTEKEIHEINTNPLLERYFITNENGAPIGFCLLGFGENTAPGTDWYVAEFYVLPSHRMRKYGENAVAELLQTHIGKYCIFVLKENIPAQMFWNKTLQTFNCTDITSNYDSTSYTPSDCDFYAFETAE